MASLWLLLVTGLLISCTVRAFDAFQPPPQLPSGPRVVNLCYFNFGSPDDLGWTFQFNLGRIHTHNALLAVYPQKDIYSHAIYNVFDAMGDNPVTHVVAWVDAGCHVIISNNNALLGSDNDHTALATNYSQRVAFIQLNENAFSRPRYGNFAYYQFDPTAAYYFAGVMSALQLPAKIGFLAAWEAHRNPVEAFNGFIFGVRSVSATLPVELVNMQSWYDPGNESIAANLLLGRGCTLIARYSDPHDVDSIIQTGGSGQQWSVGSHSDLQQYVGDSVLASIFVNWEVMLIPMLRSWIDEGSFSPSLPIAYGIDGGVAPSKVSSAARSSAMKAAAVLSDVTNRSARLICGTSLTTWLKQPVPVNAATNCVGPAQPYPGFILQPAVTYHGAFPRLTDCGPGQAGSYDSSTGIKLVCTNCPPGAVARPGATRCIPCPAASMPSLDASQCVPAPVETIFGAGLIAAIVVPSIVSIAAVIGCIVLCVQRQRNLGRFAGAPTKPPLCFVVTRVEFADRLWSDYPVIMQKTIRLHNDAIREVIADFNAFEVSSGDSFVIVCKTAIDGVLISMRIQEALHRVKWLHHFRDSGEDTKLWRGLRVGAGVAWCTEVDVVIDNIRCSVDYLGVEIENARKLCQHSTGGQTLCTRATLVEARKDSDYSYLVAQEVCMAKCDVEGRQPGTTIAALSLLPSQFAGRAKEFTIGNGTHVLETDFFAFPSPGMGTNNSPHPDAVSPSSPNSAGAGDNGGTATTAAGASDDPAVGTTLGALFMALTPETQRSVICEVLGIKRRNAATVSKAAHRNVAAVLRSRGLSGSGTSGDLEVHGGASDIARDNFSDLPALRLSQPGDSLLLPGARSDEGTSDVAEGYRLDVPGSR